MWISISWGPSSTISFYVLLVTVHGRRKEAGCAFSRGQTVSCLCCLLNIDMVEEELSPPPPLFVSYTLIGLRNPSSSQTWWQKERERGHNRTKPKEKQAWSNFEKKGPGGFSDTMTELSGERAPRHNQQKLVPTHHREATMKSTFWISYDRFLSRREKYWSVGPSTPNSFPAGMAVCAAAFSHWILEFGFSFTTLLSLSRVQFQNNSSGFTELFKCRNTGIMSQATSNQELRHLQQHPVKGTHQFGPGFLPAPRMRGLRRGASLISWSHPIILFGFFLECEDQEETMGSCCSSLSKLPLKSSDRHVFNKVKV